MPGLANERLIQIKIKIECFLKEIVVSSPSFDHIYHSEWLSFPYQQTAFDMREIARRRWRGFDE